MKCPHCDLTLLVSERQGVEIDHCPECRGVWLDRGELDKIVERHEAQDRDDGRRGAALRDDYEEENDNDRRRDREHPRERKSFWRELFD